MKSSIWLVMLPVLVMMTACTGPALTAEALTCEVEISTPAAGSITVIRMDPSPSLPFNLPLQVIWQPPASGQAIDFVVAYSGVTPDKTMFPIGGHAQFKAPAVTGRGQYQALVSADGVKIAHYDLTDKDFGATEGDVAFDAETPEGKAVLTALANRKSIRIDVLQAGDTLVSGTFDTSPTAARDALFAEAWDRVDASDPKVCRPI